MGQDRWTVAEYRRYLDTGIEPAGMVKTERILRDAEHQLSVEEAYARAEREGRVMEMIIPDETHAPKTEKRRSKYGNHRVFAHNRWWDSEHELGVYEELLLRVKAGELKCVICQVKFDLLEKEKMQYVADFVTVRPDMTIEVLDAKSEATKKNQVYLLKKKLMRERWGIEIQEV